MPNSSNSDEYVSFDPDLLIPITKNDGFKKWQKIGKIYIKNR